VHVGLAGVHGAYQVLLQVVHVLVEQGFCPFGCLEHVRAFVDPHNVRVVHVRLEGAVGVSEHFGVDLLHAHVLLDALALAGLLRLGIERQMLSRVNVGHCGPARKQLQLLEVVGHVQTALAVFQRERMLTLLTLLADVTQVIVEGLGFGLGLGELLVQVGVVMVEGRVHWESVQLGLHDGFILPECVLNGGALAQHVDVVVEGG